MKLEPDEGSGFRVLGFRALGFGGSEFRVWGLGFRVLVVGFGVQWFRV